MLKAWKEGGHRKEGRKAWAGGTGGKWEEINGAVARDEFRKAKTFGGRNLVWRGGV